MVMARPAPVAEQRASACFFAFVERAEKWVGPRRRDAQGFADLLGAVFGESDVGSRAGACRPG